MLGSEPREISCPSPMTLSRVVIVACGASRTALGVFSRKGKGLRFDRFAAETLPLTAGQEDNWFGNTRTALLELGRRVKVAGPVILILPPHLVLTKFIKTPRVDPAKHAKIVQFEAAQNISSALTDVVWDSLVTGGLGPDLEVMLAAAKLDAVEPLCDAAQAAGFEPRFVLPPSLATIAGFRLAHPAQSPPALVVDLGARSTTLLLVGSKRLLARTLPFGGSSITRQIAANQNCAAEEAEVIKLSGRGAGLTADAMESFATRLAQEINRSVLYFRRQGDLEDPVCIHLTGGGARLTGLDAALAAKLKVPVTRLDVLKSVEIAHGAAESEAAEHALTLGDLIGAAATQLQTAQPVLNLLPPRWRNLENLSRRQPWLIAAAVLVVAALVPPVVHQRNVTAEALRKTAALERMLVPLRERDGRNRVNLQQLAELGREVAQLQGVYDRRASWLNLLADLQDRLGRVEDVWFEKLQVVPAVAGAPVKLAISGCMLARTIPLAIVGPETTNRVKALLTDIDHSPYVKVAEEGQRFDRTRPGILKFDFVLVADPQHPL